MIGTCLRCGGYGHVRVAWADYIDCPTCGGQGHLAADRPDDYPEATVSPWHYDAAGHRVAGPAPAADFVDLPFDPPDPEFDPRDDMHVDCGHDDDDGPAWMSR